MERARADRAFRDALIVDLEAALEAEGYEPISCSSRRANALS